MFGFATVPEMAGADSETVVAARRLPARIWEEDHHEHHPSAKPVHP
jgi:hypothetical protein